MKADSGKKLLSEINVTPFVDVMLVLLIIFMVAAPLMVAGVPLSLPQTSAQAVPPAQKPLVVSVTGDGQVFLAEQPIQPEQPAAAPAFFPSCGAKGSGEKFCQNCGAPLR